MTGNSPKCNTPSDISNECMAWFQVLFLDDIIEVGQVMGYFEKQEALSSISSVGQWAYTEYSSFSRPREGE